MRSMVEGLFYRKKPLHRTACGPHGQVRIAPRSEAMSGGHGDLPILQMQGRKSGQSFAGGVQLSSIIWMIAEKSLPPPPSASAKRV